jgi:HK97 family phage major capsid protein
MNILQQAKEKALAGDLDGARALREQATEVKAIEALTVVDPTAGRLPIPDASQPTSDESMSAGATKMIGAAYVKRFGSIDAGVDQVAKELYGSDNYPMLHARKMADLNFYCKSGVIRDHGLSKQVLLSPEQLFMAVANGVPVADGQYTIKATMVEAQDTLLGYMVPETLNQEMVQRLPGLTVVRGLARKFTTGGDSLSFLVRTGGNSRYIGNTRSKQTSESPVSTYNTNATFGKLIIPVHVNLYKVPVSKSGLEDSQFDVMNQVLMPEIQTEAAITEDQQFLLGTGSNEPQGILIDNTTGGPSNADILTQNTGQAADVSFDAVVKAPWKLAGQYRNKRSASVAFAFNAATGGVLASLKNSTGDYLWTEMYGNNAQGNADTLRGWNVRESEALPSIAANTFPILFGDWSGYRIVDRVGMAIQRYDDSNTAETDSVVFFVRRRYGGQVAEGYKFVAIKCATPIN